LPVIYLIAGDTGLKDEVRIAPNGVEWVVLYRSQALEYAWYIGGCEVVEGEEAACLFARDVYGHRLYLYIKM
jgi:hypothetical protein